MYHIQTFLTLAQLPDRASTFKHASHSRQAFPLHGWLDDGMGDRINTNGSCQRLPWHVGVQVWLT